MGIATVWVNRPSPRPGAGAAKAAAGKPDLEVPDLKTLAQPENRELKTKNWFENSATKLGRH